MEIMGKSKEIQNEISLINKDKLNSKLLDNLTILKQDIPDNLIVEDFIILKNAIRQKKNTLKSYVQHDYEIKLSREINKELNLNSDWINISDGKDTLMEKISNEITLKDTCEKYLSEQFINIINKINKKVNEQMEKGISLSNENSKKILLQFLEYNNLNNDNNHNENIRTKANTFIKNGKITILSPDSIRKDVNRVEKSLEEVKVNRKVKNRFNEMKNRYEMVIKLIDKTYKDKGNKYDTIKMLNDSVKPQCMEIIDDITKEIKNKRNNITIDKANKKVKKLFLNKEILAQKRKDINKKKLPSTIKKIGT